MSLIIKCQPPPPLKHRFTDTLIEKVKATTWQLSKGGFTMDVHKPGDSTINAVENLATLYNHEEILISEISQNDSVKRCGTNSKRTVLQLKFIIDCMEVGVLNKEHKMSPSFACRLMKQLGTEEGFSTAQYSFARPSLHGYPVFCKKKYFRFDAD